MGRTCIHFDAILDTCAFPAALLFLSDRRYVMSTSPVAKVPQFPSRLMPPLVLQWLLLGSVLLVSMAWAGDRWEIVSHDEGYW
jgi:hypothetical protein